jgi:hypothetical protein
MARESFEDDYVAQLLNRGFVPIKVDREERPDLDGIYMSACQMISGGGGWPLTVVATPEGEPFFAGTYFSKGGGPGSPGLIDILQQLETGWKLEREKMRKAAAEVTAALRTFAAFREPAELSVDALALCYKQLERNFDERNGGFEIAPKFPSPHRLVFLLRYHRLSGEAGALRMASHTLTSMRRSGLYDHLGFGFHRYSTDARWVLPHFEKMLYDQAMMALAFSEAYALTRDPSFKETAMATFEYVRRDMTSPDGAFYSAESAESEGEEGRYYIWSRKEVEEELEPSDLALFVEAFDVQPEGNFRDEATRKRTGKNVLHLTGEVSAIATARGMGEEEAWDSLRRSLRKLAQARERRERPLKDDKVLTDWNGLMIASLARSSRLLGEPELAGRARRAADLLLSTMRREGRLRHRLVDGQVGIDGFLDDYAFLAWGLLELDRSYEGYAATAKDLVDVMIEHFWDEDQGGFFFTADDAEGLIARRMEGYDGAIPSGNSVAANVLLGLHSRTRDRDKLERARRTLRAFAADINHNPMAHAHMLQAKLDLREKGVEVGG